MLNCGPAKGGIRHQRERETKQQSFPSAALIKQLIRCELRWMCCCKLWVWGPGPSQSKGKGTDLGSVGMKPENFYYLIYQDFLHCRRTLPVLQVIWTCVIATCLLDLIWHFKHRPIWGTSVFCVLIHLPLAACGFPKADFSSRRDPLTDLSCLPESWKNEKGKIFSILQYFIIY